jgi:hypothetical protein
VLAWADVLEPRLRGRSHRWFADVMRAVVGDEDDEPDRVVLALGLTCDGRVLELLLEEAEDLSDPPRHNHPHIQAQETPGISAGG